MQSAGHYGCWKGLQETANLSCEILIQQIVLCAGVHQSSEKKHHTPTHSEADKWWFKGGAITYYIEIWQGEV